MAYSNFSRKQAGVLFAQMKNGNIEMTDAAVRMMYERADAYINHDVVLDDIEAKLRNAVNAAIAGDFKTAQEEVDLACKAHDFHWNGERTARETPKTNTLTYWAVIHMDGEIIDKFLTFDDESKDRAEECANDYNRMVGGEVCKVVEVSE